MFIVVSPVNKWKKVCYPKEAREPGGAAMLLSLFISCVLRLLKC